MNWNLADIFESVVDAAGEREALIVANTVDGTRRFTYAELEDRANRLAHALAAGGVSAGDKVGILAFNGNEWVEAQWAAWKLRAVPVNVNYRYVEHELQYLLENSDAVGLVHGAEFSPRLAAIRDGLPKLSIALAFPDGSGNDISASGSLDYETALAAQSGERDFAERSNDDIYMLYTGGTTGLPKGVMWRHEDFFKATMEPLLTLGGEPITEAGMVAERAANGMATRAFPVAPLMHGAAQWGALTNAFSGGTLILSSSHSFDPVDIWNIVAEHKVMSLAIVGDAQARPLVDCLGEEFSPDLSSLFLVSSGGAILSPSVRERFAEAIPNVMLFDGLGASETGVQGVGSGSDAHGRPTFAMNESTFVIDDSGQPAAPGVVGRLVRQGYMPIGYYKDEKKTAETFPTINGKRYVVSGDMAVTEEDGQITLLGRGSVSINTGGEKVYPEEVESVLKGHPDIFDAVVVGVKDERWGERVTAVVVAREGTTPDLESVHEVAAKQIAGYKLPKELVFVDEMVRSPSGKADYRWARTIAAEQSKL